MRGTNPSIDKITTKKALEGVWILLRIDFYFHILITVTGRSMCSVVLIK